MALTSSAKCCVCFGKNECSSNCVMASCVELYVLTHSCTPAEGWSSHTCKYLPLSNELPMFDIRSFYGGD